jgi:hypothetical protein
LFFRLFLSGHMSASSFLHSDRLSDRGVLLVPSCPSAGVLTMLLRQLGGRKVALLTEVDAALGQDVRQAVIGSGVSRIIRTEPGARAAVAQVLAARPIVEPLGLLEVPGRADAIRAALAQAQSGDVVLLAGKGHEQGQIVGTDVLPFDDAEVARTAAGELPR